MQQAYILTAASPSRIDVATSRNGQACLGNTGREDVLVAMCISMGSNQGTQMLSALACQKLLLMSLEHQNWPNAASFALNLCEGMPEEAAAGLAIALLGARHTKTGSQTMPPAAPQPAQRLQDSPLFAESAEPSWDDMQDSSGMVADGQQALSEGGVVHLVTHLHLEVHCLPSYSVVESTLPFRGTPLVKSHCIPRYIACQAALLSKVHDMPRYIAWGTCTAWLTHRALSVSL